MERGADLPEGLETIVADSFRGSSSWRPVGRPIPFRSSYGHEESGCLVTHTLYDLGERTAVGDLKASAMLLSTTQNRDLSKIEPVILPLPFTTDPLIGDDQSDLLSMEFAAYSAGDVTKTIWAARAIEKVGKGFVVAVTCRTDDELVAAFKETTELLAFGLFDPAVFGGVEP